MKEYRPWFESRKRPARGTSPRARSRNRADGVRRRAIKSPSASPFRSSREVIGSTIGAMGGGDILDHGVSPSELSGFGPPVGIGRARGEGALLGRLRNESRVILFEGLRSAGALSG